MQVAFNPPAVAPVLTFPGIGQRPAAFRTLISVAPIEYRKQCTYHGSPIYVMPAAPKDGYSKLRVYDHQVWQLNRNSVSDDDPGKMDLLPMEASSVATDFLNHCIGGNLGAKEGFHPGVVLCTGEEPTEAEIKAAFAAHTAYARWVVNDGTRLANANEFFNITEEHRRQADWLGVQVPWKAEMQRQQMKKCIGCAGEIRYEALVCQHCHQVLPDLFEKLGLDESDDPIVAKAVAKRKPAAATPIAPPIANPQNKPRQ